MVINKKGEEVKDLVSIIVPVLNSELYLSKCLEAIINQTYQYLDIIIVDNASKDSSVSIVKNYMKKDNRIRLFEKEEMKSCGHSRNMGLINAKGKYVSFIDSDDYPEPNFIENMLQTLIDNEVNIVQCCYYVFDDFGERRDTLNYYEDRIYSGKELCKIMQDFVGLAGPNIMLWTKLYKKEVFEDFSFYENRAYEDMFKTYILLYKEEKIVWIADRLMNWRKNSFSGTSKYNYRKWYLDEIYAYIERARFFLERNEIELYELTMKRLYYISTQHLYLYNKFIDDNSRKKVSFWLKDLIKETYQKLMKMSRWSLRTRIRMKFIRLFPWLFGYISVNYKLDFRK